MSELTRDQLDKKLQRHLIAVPTGRKDVPDLSLKDARKGLKLPDRGRALLGATDTDGEDRSARLFELAALLREAGASEEATFVLVRNSVWNKFEGRDDEVELIWDAIEKWDPDNKEAELRERFRVGRGEPELVGNFLDRDIPAPSWLVQGVLQKGGLHFVAAPKKCYKSTFVTDLALSVVSGSPFLNGVNVDQRASVLMLQEENPEGLQQLRLRAMTRAKGVSLHGAAPMLKDDGVVECDFSHAPFWQINMSGLKLCHEECRNTIENWIKRKHIEVLILDPLYVMAGCEIMYGRDILDILEWWLHLKHDLKVTVLVVHHMKKLPEEVPADLGQLMFGSSYLANAYDGAILLMPRYVEGTMMIEKVHAVRDYRAWREGAFDFSIWLEEDGSEYIVQLEDNRKHEHPLVHLVRKRPGITRREAAAALGVDPTNVSAAAKRHGLVIRKVAGEGAGRPQIAFFPQENTSEHRK